MEIASTNMTMAVTVSPLSICGYGANCVNTVGSFECVCPIGYDGDAGVECTDVNECSNGVGVACGVNAKCLNLPGSFKCICPPGFAGNAAVFCNS